MKILDAGTQMLDDYDVLKFIREKQQQHKEEDAAAKAEGRKNNRPANFTRALKKHEEHLMHPDRPFANNPNYDDQAHYLNKLIQTLSPHVSLTKTEYLVLANMRPYRRKQLGAMIEDIDSRFTLEQQNFIRDAVVQILGLKEGAEPNEDAMPVEVKGG